MVVARTMRRASRMHGSFKWTSDARSDAVAPSGVLRGCTLEEGTCLMVWSSSETTVVSEAASSTVPARKVSSLAAEEDDAGTATQIGASMLGGECGSLHTKQAACGGAQEWPHRGTMPLDRSREAGTSV
jgi:hypothetical protein